MATKEQWLNYLAEFEDYIKACKAWARDKKRELKSFGNNDEVVAAEGDEFAGPGSNPPPPPPPPPGT